MAVLADTLAFVDWAGWVFVALIAIGGAYLLRLDRDASKFRLVDLISDADGKAYSPVAHLCRLLFCRCVAVLVSRANWAVH